MSSPDPRRYANDNAIDNTTYIDAIAIAGCVMAGLIALVILRFLVNLCIDVVILGDLDSVRRSLGSFTRRICPWWHRRTQPEELASTDERGQDVELGNTLGRHSLEQRKTIIAAILPSKMLSNEDIKKMKGDEPDANHVGDGESSQTSFGVCSICLVEFDVGDQAVTAERCAHTFHRNCIVEWLGSHRGTDCPYCRTQMISADTLEEASHSHHEHTS